ncbi:unnamed protein product, partial [Haemonchus placei]|uniref:Transposase n=1 Tax=Haemonchus placei TaxID=6290 RepID=A0A0N4W3E1_HAEPC
GSNLSIASNPDSEVAKVSATTDNGEVRRSVHFGDRLLDDLMNTFCDRLQAACPRKIDGCLAIQFVMVIASFIDDEITAIVCTKFSGYVFEPQSLKTLVNVGRPAHQIIFDPDRVHYVVVDYDPQTKIVVLYDSLVEKDSNATHLVRRAVMRQSVKIPFKSEFNSYISAVVWSLTIGWVIIMDKAFSIKRSGMRLAFDLHSQ